MWFFISRWKLLVIALEAQLFQPDFDDIGKLVVFLRQRADANYDFYIRGNFFCNFIFLFQDNLEGVEGNEKLGSLMHESFKEATKLDPENFDYHLRFAQSFFDIEDSSHEEALLAWEVLINEFGERTTKEQDYIKINKSRILLHLQRFNEATTLLRSVNSEIMKEEKEKLLEKAKQSLQRL